MLKKLIEEGKSERGAWTSIEKHIGCYPWQKRLLEYYGIRYKQKDDDKIKYLTLDEIIEKQYGFADGNMARD